MTIYVPYRNRPDHLAQFIPHMRKQIPSATLIVIEPLIGCTWNREKLFNIAVREYTDESFICHDIDMLPINFHYTPYKGVMQLAKSSIQRQGYLGGVTMYDLDTYKRAGGYHNDYWGGRAGDNEMAFNLQRLGISVARRPCTFRILFHPRSGPEFIPELWVRAQEPRVVQDQLSACVYEVVSREEKDGYTHLIVKI